MGKIDIREHFLTPPKEYSPVPFWFWNGNMDDGEICSQLEKMVEQGIYETIIHSRKGGTIPYLSDLWFKKISLAINKAKELGMRLWIYDEDDWPSGYAGGRVYQRNPDFAAKCLSVEKIYPVLNKPVFIKEISDKELVAVVAVYQDKEFVDITDNFLKSGKGSWEATTLSWEIFVFRMEKCLHSPAYSDEPYIDLLNKEATDTFIEVTHKAYKNHFPNDWGKTIKGFFVDEPGFYQNYFEQMKNINTIAWTRNFASYFYNVQGYDIKPYLPSLFQKMPISDKIHHDYYSVLTKLYKESFFDPIRTFLNKDGLLLIGHLHREERLEWLVQTEGNFFSTIDGLDYSGIDCIDREYPRLTERLCSSSADLLNKERALSETFGCFGYKLTPTEMKRVIDIQFAQGINMLVPHAFFYSIEGIRKQESPPSLFFQNDYWPNFRCISQYVSRLSFMLSRGKHNPKIALYYPDEYAETIFSPLNHKEIQSIDDALKRISKELLFYGIDFMLVPDSFLRKAVVNNGLLKINDFEFSSLIIPSFLPREYLSLINDFSKSGLVLSFGEEKDNSYNSIFYSYFNEKRAISYVNSKIDKGFVGKNVIFYSRTDNVKINFFVNTSSKTNHIKIPLDKDEHLEEWDLETGKTYLLKKKKNVFFVDVFLKKNESKLLIISKEENNLKAKTDLPKKKRVLKPSICLFDGAEKLYYSAHQNKLFSFKGEVDLHYSFSIRKKPNKAFISFDNVHDFLFLTTNNKAIKTHLWEPFIFDISKYLKVGTNNISVKIYGCKANEIENDDRDVGLSGKTFLYLE